jgi:hypothetical protein
MAWIIAREQVAEVTTSTVAHCCGPIESATDPLEILVSYRLPGYGVDEDAVSGAKGAS